MAALAPLSVEDWDARKARHLLNRAGFGVPHARAAHLADMGLEEAVGWLVDYEALPAQLEEPDFLREPVRRGQLVARNRELDEAGIQALVSEKMMAERLAIQELQAWWFARMATTPRPLEEKLTLFWHGHFATSSAKVKSSQRTYDLNRIFRRAAAGNFKKLTIAVGQSESMLDYLDNRRSTKEHPNENWARELMELFTLGQGQYTEADIKAAARAFTGWTYGRKGFDFNTNVHDTGEKTFLGQTGPLDGWKVIDIIFQQDAAAEFIAGKLWAYFAYPDPEPAIVRALAATFREHDYELRPMLRQLFSAEEFYSGKAMGTQIKSPAQFLVRLCADLGIEDVPYDRLAQASTALGQRLFYPPNVKGWDGNRAWINANALLIRYNIPPQLVQASVGLARKRAMGKMDDADGGMMMQASMMQHDSDAEPATMPFRELVREWRKETFNTLQERMADESKAAQKAARGVLSNGTPTERRALLEQYHITLPPWEAADPAWLIDELEFTTAGECLDALADRFLAMRPGADQRALLLKALGFATPEDPATPETISIDHRHAVLHLITSMAEYQVC